MSKQEDQKKADQKRSKKRLKYIDIQKNELYTFFIAIYLLKI